MSPSDQKTKVFFLRVVILAAPGFLFIGAFVYHLNLSGVRAMEYNFSQQNPLISPLFPASRLQGVEQGGQTVQDEPVYFTVRALRPYQKAEVAIQVMNAQQLPWKVGVLTNGLGDFAYDLHEPASDGTMSLDLSNARRVANVYRFIISIPGGIGANTFRVEDIKVRLTGVKGFDLLKTSMSKALPS